MEYWIGFNKWLHHGGHEIIAWWANEENDPVLASGQRLSNWIMLIEGGKSYLPWTFFDDGKWRRMEPDEGLPLFGVLAA
ncbi:MAG: hypothetical protein WBC86_14770 [Pseudolabrys sp.]